MIGTRRAGSRRRLKAALGLVGVCALVAVVAYTLYRRVVAYEMPEGSAPSGAIEAGTGASGATVVLGPASLAHAGRVTHVSLDGDVHALGAQHGRLLRERVREVAATLAPTVAHTVDDDGFLGGLTRALRLRWRWRLIDDGIPGHQLVELAGLVRGAGGSYEEAVRTSATLDVGTPAPGSPGERLRALVRSLTLALPVRGAAGDRLLLGHTVALVGAADGGRAAAAAPTLFTVRGDGVIPFAHVGWPGMTGVLTGVNAEGIAVLVHPARTAEVRVTRAAQPAPLIARELLENARSLDEAIAVLEHAEPLGAATFVLGDGKSRRWAVVERSPKKIEVRRDPSTPAVGDLFGGISFADDPLVDRARRTRPIEQRVDRATELARRAPEDAAAAVALLRDRKAPGGAALPAGHRGAVDDPDAAHTVLLDASALVLWVGEGPGAAGRFRAFDLRHLLRDEGQRPAPPPDVPADPDAIASAEAVLAARSLALAARAAAREGRLAAAREHAVRALAHAPDLPEALLLAGELARQAGDEDAALAHLRRYLEVGPDDLGAREQAEALVGPR